MKPKYQNVICNKGHGQLRMPFCSPIFYHGEIIILNYKKIKRKNEKNLQLQYFVKWPGFAKRGQR
jgi:hypothetical protein